MTNPGSINNVQLEEKAFVTMIMHACRHKHSPIHGLLLGRSDTSNKSTVIVEEAVPICHCTPTRPLVELAIGLVEAMIPTRVIVGWYTAPTLLEDTTPGPVALRMAANLVTTTIDPVLLVLQNRALSVLVKEGTGSDTVVKAYGKNFGQQWLDPLSITLSHPDESTKAVLDGKAQCNKVNDLTDHLQQPAASLWCFSSEVNQPLS